MSIENILKNIVIVLLSIYVIYYSLRPTTRNPQWIMIIHKHPWMLIPLLLITYYIYMYDIKIGILVMIILMAVYMDIIMFIKK